MQKKKIHVFILLLAIILLVLSSCTQSKECSVPTDCASKQGYKSVCIQNKCIYKEIPKNICGNSVCESGEDFCSCSEDCASCPGVGKSFKSACVNNECSFDVDSTKQKLEKNSEDVKINGDTFQIATNISNPLNVKKNTVQISIALTNENKLNSNRKIRKLTLTGKTKDNKAITLAQKETLKNLWTGLKYAANEELIIQSNEKEVEITNPELIVDYDYTIISAGKSLIKTSSFKTSQLKSLKLTLLTPTVPAKCPASCPEQKGYTASCPSGSGFCEYTPKLNSCGNQICEVGETKCNCAIDCSPCEKTTDYLTFSCVKDYCVGTLKQDVNVKLNNIFEEKQIKPAILELRYKWNEPFNVITDKINVEAKAQSFVGGDYTRIGIDSIQVMEGNNEVSMTDVKKVYATITDVISANITLPKSKLAEDSKNLALNIWYTYTEKGVNKKEDFKKDLGKITLLNPEGQ